MVGRTKKPGPKTTASHSVRTRNDLWAAAKRRAEAEGTTLNEAINELLEGYARGMIKLPRIVKQYAPIVAAVPATSDESVAVNQ